MSEFEEILTMIDVCTENILTELKFQVGTATEELTTLVIVGICITAVLGIAILWNQRKIKKMLREMQEKKDEKC